MAEGYSFEAILERMLSRVPNDVDKREGSIIYDALSPVAYALGAQNYMLACMTDLLFGDTATGEWLDRVTNDFGISRRAATRAVRRISCTDTSGNAMQVENGAMFGLNGVIFTVCGQDENGCLAVCEAAGSEGNAGAGAMLPINGIAGLGSAVLLAAPAEYAVDRESDEQLRQRFYDTVRQTAFGGNRADYRQKALNIDGVFECAVFAASDGMGAGHVGLMIAGEQGGPASTELVERVETAFMGDGDGNGLAPVGHSVSVASCAELTVNVSVSLLLKSGASLSVVQPPVVSAIERYIGGISFEAETVFSSRLTAAVLSAHEAILDVSAVSINGAGGNLALSKTFALYQIPVCGEITVTQEV